jgi:hypothetical protein
MAGKKIEMKFEGIAPTVSEFKPGNYYSIIMGGIEYGGYIEKDLKLSGKKYFNTLREINENCIINNLYEIHEKEGIVLDTKFLCGKITKKGVSLESHWMEINHKLNKIKNIFFKNTK